MGMGVNSRGLGFVCSSATSIGLPCRSLQTIGRAKDAQSGCASSMAEKIRARLNRVGSARRKKGDSQPTAANNDYTRENSVFARGCGTSRGRSRMNWTEQVVLVTGGTGSFGRKFVD